MIDYSHSVCFNVPSIYGGKATDRIAVDDADPSGTKEV